MVCFNCLIGRLQVCWNLPKNSVTYSETGFEQPRKFAVKIGCKTRVVAQSIVKIIRCTEKLSTENDYVKKLVVQVRFLSKQLFLYCLYNVCLQWQESKTDIEDRGTAIMDALQGASAISSGPDASLPDTSVIHKCYQQLSKSYDTVMGGFGKSPKFPQPGSFLQKLELKISKMQISFESHRTLIVFSNNADNTRTYMYLVMKCNYWEW